MSDSGEGCAIAVVAVVLLSLGAWVGCGVGTDEERSTWCAIALDSATASDSLRLHQERGCKMTVSR